MDNVMLLTAAPLLNVQLLLDGLLIGAVYALPAYGLALVWGVITITNLPQGDFVMMCRYIALVAAAHGIPPTPALPTAPLALFLSHSTPSLQTCSTPFSATVFQS